MGHLNLVTDQSQLEELVRETLFERRLIRQGCFVGNQAGRELIASSVAALPAIERVIRDSVEPGIAEGVATARAFHGLDYVLGAYLVIATKSAPERAVAFLTSSCVALQVAALGAIRTFFQRKGDGYNCGVAPSPHFRAFAQQLVRSNVGDLRSAAERTLRYVTWPLEEQEEGEAGER